ncbi:MAG: type II secretion system F family protein [Rickettsiales bacterium]
MQRTPMMVDIALFGGAALFFAVVFLLVKESQRKEQLAARIARVRHAAPVKKGQKNEKTSLRRQTNDPSLAYVSNVAETLGFIEKLRNRLDMAGMALAPERYVIVSLALMFFSTIIIYFTSGKPFILAALIGLIIGLGFPHIYVGLRIGKRKKRFLSLFPDAIDLVVRGLRAGLPVTKSMQTVADEIADPVAGVFREMVDQMGLGVPLEKTLYSMADRLDLTEFNFFVTSIILQRETGGNLGEILNNLSEVLRQRHMFKMKIKAMSMEARASATIVGSLPFFVFAILSIFSPDYLQPLYDDYRGNIAALGSLASLGTGVLIMAKMTRFEI